MIKRTLQDLLKFTVRPDDHQANLNTKNKMYILFILLLINLVISYALIIPAILKIEEFIPLEFHDISYLSFLQIFLFIVIIIPFFEELVFRYFLRYKGITTRLISREKWKKVFPVLVYSSIISFGFVHLTNYSNTGLYFFLFSPIIILSQLVGGLFMTFLRVRLNFYWGLFFHMMFNFLVMIGIPFVHYSFKEPYIEKTGSHTIMIDEKLFFEKERQSIKIDSMSGKIYLLEVEHYSMQHLADTLFGKNKFETYDVLVNLEFKSKEGIPKAEFIDILNKTYEDE